jgi:hypothetical protein
MDSSESMAYYVIRIGLDPRGLPMSRRIFVNSHYHRRHQPQDTIAVVLVSLNIGQVTAIFEWLCTTLDAHLRAK